MVVMILFSITTIPLLRPPGLSPQGGRHRVKFPWATIPLGRPFPYCNHYYIVPILPYALHSEIILQCDHSSIPICDHRF